MYSMVGIVETIKKVAVKAVNSQKLTDIVYGTVISTSPLKVQIDQKLTLEQEHLKLTRAVKDYETEMTVDHTTEMSESHSHAIKGKKKVTIHNGLKNGDRVTMIRSHGGQQFIVIDKE